MKKIGEIILIYAIMFMVFFSTLTDETCAKALSDDLVFPFLVTSKENNLINEQWTYMLDIGDVEKEIRQWYAGESTITWTNNVSGQCFISQLLTLKDGFLLPEAFFTHWQQELTQNLVTYWNFTENTGAYCGWALYDSLEPTQEEMYIQFKQPLFFWDVNKDYVETTTTASVMKFDTISLFSPQAAEKEKPELEGHNLTAMLCCEKRLQEPEHLIIDYILNIRGNCVIRCRNPNLRFTAIDTVEPCTLTITRKGTMEVAKNISMGVWFIISEVYTESWYAKSTISEMMVNESSLSGPNQRYSLILLELPDRKPLVKQVIDVRDYGAVGDGITLDTDAINAAIQVCANEGGGIVCFLDGVYLSGSLHLKSNVTLQIDHDAILRGTRDMTKYDPREYNPWGEYQDSSQSYMHHSLIWGENISNVGILGPGLIDGNDAFEPWPIINRTIPPPFGWLLSTICYQINDTIFQRGAKPVAFKSCTNILIKDITITHSPDETIFIAGCNNVLIEGFTAQEVRVDGIDPICCHNVTITNCEINSLDDAIAIKSSYVLGYKRSCENITVKNCFLCTFINALKIGTESVGDFKHIIYHDCIIYNSPYLPSFAGISILSIDGGTIDGVTASNIIMRNVNYPIFIRLGDRLRTPEHATIGTIQNISLHNIAATGAKRFSTITGLPDHPVGENINLSNISIICKGGGRRLFTYRRVPERRESNGIYPDPPYLFPGVPPAYGFFCRHIRGLTFKNVYLGFQRPDLRAAMICEDIDDFSFSGFEAERALFGAPSVIIR